MRCISFRTLIVLVAALPVSSPTRTVHSATGMTKEVSNPEFKDDEVEHPPLTNIDKDSSTAFATLYTKKLVQDDFSQYILKREKDDSLEVIFLRQGQANGTAHGARYRHVVRLHSLEKLKNRMLKVDTLPDHSVDLPILEFRENESRNDHGIASFKNVAPGDYIMVTYLLDYVGPNFLGRCEFFESGKPAPWTPVALQQIRVTVK